MKQSTTKKRQIKETQEIDYIFEASWEVCNKIGGIHTVLTTKAKSLLEKYDDRIIFIGPDLVRGERENPEFTEDDHLFADWKAKEAEQGVRVKVGRWNIQGNPIVFLVDFTSFIAQKDEIFKNYWEQYKLNSLSGRWDYVESVLFGYVTGKVIDGFYDFYLKKQENVVAHFHEWMSGAGILYLKNNAQHVATVFTTHSTIVGRSISSNMQPLYNNLEKYNAINKSLEFNIVSRHSLEELCAQNADCFTTVSRITAKECKYFLQREPDLVTPNGFNESILPIKSEYDNKRNQAREKLTQIAEALFGYQLSENPLIVGTSGRYEFRNKGIDLYLDALKKLNEDPKLKREILAFIFIPADTQLERKDLLERLNNSDVKSQIPLENNFITHQINNIDYDIILNKIKELGLKNSQEDKVKVIYIPIYLNGRDEIIDLDYYQTLIGLDLTVFPSYYEPWGYTPLESLAFQVPTITTTLAGFGVWTKKKETNEEVVVLNRNDDNYDEVLNNLTDSIYQYAIKNESEIKVIKENALETSKQALWKNFIQNYYTAYELALSRRKKKRYISPTTDEVKVELPKIGDEPVWKRITVDTILPESIRGLEELSKNVWWSWNLKARKLFKMIDPELWNRIGRNPIAFLKNVPYGRLEALANDTKYLKQYNEAYGEFKSYLKEKPRENTPKIAYFSMEYGIISTLKIYSGGLGILAGDYLKEASDSNFNMVAVGLLYRYGYFTQQLTLTGEQKDLYKPEKFSEVPVTPLKNEDGSSKTISLTLPGRELYARIWKVNVGRVKLYLLDTDFEDNNNEDRQITYKLYGGDWENRLKQEILLGIGGIKLLNELGIEPDLYHCNEGHAAFINLKRLTQYIKKYHFSFEEALEIVRASSLFTTHTPVPAGHDAFPEDMIRTYFRNMPDNLKISWEKFIGLGKEHPNNPSEKFSMSVLAINTSQEVNGVSKLHGEVSREMFKNLWRGYFKNELHIDYVTNGVHYPTWTAKEWRRLYEGVFGEVFLKDQSNKKHWEKIHTVEDEKIWAIKKIRKQKLINFITERIKRNWIDRYESPKRIIEILNQINPDILTIGFARRFATYKRAHLLFYDIDRLAKIVNNEERPVQFIFAGKAHPHDKAGQDLIKMIVAISKRPEFSGKIIFLEDYDMRLAKRMVKGVDVWMNTPTRPLEASGTSGEKAQMNGVLNFSVLDGWWCEGYRKGAGWALPQEKTFENQRYQDELDVTTVYSLLENEIIPLYYGKDEKGIPTKWIGYIKNSIAQITPNFTTKRMIDDYNRKFYLKQFERTKKVKKNNFELATEIVKWKRRVEQHWDNIKVVDIDTPFGGRLQIKLNEIYTVKVVLDVGELKDTEIKVEAIVASEINELKDNEVISREFEVEKKADNLVFYKYDLQIENSGSFRLGLRIFPYHPELPHKQDFSLVKWV